VVSAFVTTKTAASLVFSSAAISDGVVYTVYTGGTATVSAGLGDGSLDGAQKVGTVTAGDYTAAQRPGGGFGPAPDPGAPRHSPTPPPSGRSLT
jgi:hypothetical protein